MSQENTTVAFGVTVWGRGVLNGHFDGIGVYTREIYLALKALTVSLNITIEPAGFGKATLVNGETVHCLESRFVTHVLKSLFFKKRIDCKKIGLSPALFHATDHLIPVIKGVPVVATVMDIIPFLHPEWVSSEKRWLKNWLFKRTILSADHVITISEYSKQDLIHHFGMPPDKISVTSLGVNPAYFERIDEVQKQGVLDQYGLQAGFFLFVGTLQPRKNLEKLLEAHALLPEAYQKAHPVIIVGSVGWRVEALVEQIAQCEKNGTAKWLTYLPEDSVKCLLQSAQALLFVSLYEGFGLPMLEAFASMCPVIASNTTSIPEVAGDAAYLVDPQDVQAISKAMQLFIETPELCRRLREKGLERARLYSWERCARETLAVYLRMLESH
ncbi:MAG: glycosyltransferase family 1 protein [Gammaproteobacteria bacterium]|nr:glycosyltransferase family 1 protein [Gammaproteobacteria bacterium]